VRLNSRAGLKIQASSRLLALASPPQLSSFGNSNSTAILCCWASEAQFDMASVYENPASFARLLVPDGLQARADWAVPSTTSPPSRVQANSPGPYCLQARADGELPFPPSPPSRLQSSSPIPISPSSTESYHEYVWSNNSFGNFRSDTATGLMTLKTACMPGTSAISASPISTPGLSATKVDVGRALGTGPNHCSAVSKNGPGPLEVAAKNHRAATNWNMGSNMNGRVRAIQHR
jgi:hypothetical protein